MILKQGFHTHPKTVLLRRRGGSAAVEALQQVWLFAENARLWTFPNWTPEFVAAIGSIYPGSDLVDLLLSVGYLDPLAGGGYALHDFDQHNAALIQRWENARFGAMGAKHGSLGGRPRNPRETPGGGYPKPPEGGPNNPPYRPDQTSRENTLQPAEPSAGEFALGAGPEAKARSKPRAPRGPNPLFDALAALDGGTPNLTTRASATVGTALAEIRRATPDVTSDEIRRRSDNLLALFPTATATASSLAKHWGRCATGPAPTAPTNGRPHWRDLQAAEADLLRHPGNPEGRGYDSETVTDAQHRDFQTLRDELATAQGAHR